MWLNKILIGLLTVTAFASTSVRAEIRTFVGVDVVEIETILKYANGFEIYDFEGARLRFGIENDAGGSAGFEIISGDSDETFDPFGNLLKLETGEAFGVYATLGKLVHLRVGWSIWQTEYSLAALNLLNKETVNSLEIGLGANFSLGRNLTIYADWTVRNTDAQYPDLFVGCCEVDYESEVLSLGLNFKF